MFFLGRICLTPTGWIVKSVRLLRKYLAYTDGEVTVHTAVHRDSCSRVGFAGRNTPSFPALIQINSIISMQRNSTLRPISKIPLHPNCVFSLCSPVKWAKGRKTLVESWKLLWPHLKVASITYIASDSTGQSPTLCALQIHSFTYLLTKSPHASSCFRH